MKKKLSVFMTTVIALTLALIMASGCSFTNGTKRKSGVPIGDSVAAAQYVNFGTNETEYNIYDKIADTVAEVSRTSVAIYILNQDGSASGAGSGVIIDVSFETGSDYDAEWKTDPNVIYILTCHHVISKSGTYGTAGAGEIEIRIPDENDSYENADYVFKGYIGSGSPSDYERQGYAATLVGGDFESDVALLKLNLGINAVSGNKLSPSKIVKAKIPDLNGEYHMRKGETVIAIGNPTGICPGTVSVGNVGYINRPTSVSEIGEMTLIQISVPINPGNSGGGLYNLYGELIGITNAGSTDYEQINSAIPYYHLDSGNGFVEIAAQLGGTATDDNYGYVSGRKVKFGFVIGTNRSSQAVVSSIASGGIAYSAGLRQSDIITGININGTAYAVNSYNDFVSLWDSLEYEDVVSISGARKTWMSSGTTPFDTASMRVAFRFCDTGY